MRKFLAIICTLTFGTTPFAQQFHFKQYSLEEGLSRSGVYDIHQDKSGFLWVATEGGGVSRFDGKTFRTFTRLNGLASEKVRVIFEDDQGIIWLGTTDGLSYYENDEFQSITEEDDGISDNYIRSIAQDSEGNIWVGSNRGISIIDEKEKGVSRKLKLNFSLPNKKVRSLYRQDDIMWIGTDDGLCKFVNGKIDVITTAQGLSDNLILSIFSDNGKNLWVGTENGINKITTDTILNWSEEDGMIHHRIRNIEQDHKGNIWAGTSKGISIFDGTTFLNINRENGLSNERIRCITRDCFNNIWVGTYFGGIMRFNHQDFIAFTPREGLVSDQISAISEDEKGDIIVGTYDGVSKLKIFNNKLIRTKNVTKFQGLRDNSVNAVIKDENGYYWYGTNKGITIIKNNNVVYIDQKSGLKNAEITVIRKIDDTYWIGTRGGVAKIQTEDYRTFTVNFMTHEEGLAGDNVSSILEYKDGVWISFLDGALSTFENGKVINPILTDNVTEVTAMAIDSAGQFWIGTNGNGLFYGNYQPDTHEMELEAMSTMNYLSSNYIFSILIHQNLIWLGHENGLDLLTPNGDSTFNTQLYGPERGFFGLQNNQNAAYADKKGNLWFGTVNGLFCLRNDVLNGFTQGTPSISYIHSIKINGKPFDWKKSDWCNGVDSTSGLPVDLEVPYDQNNIAFEFIGLNFISPTNIKYSWKLEGFDLDWRQPSEKNFTAYTNLDPGKYSFLLKTSNEHGAMVGEIMQFEFKIKKPWWSTWLVRIAALILAFALVGLIISLRTRQLRKKQRTLENTILERTTEITRQKEELEVKNIEITDSILYSRRIQNSILPGKEKLNSILKDFFIFYKPKDIVSGDFYWVEPGTKGGNKIFMAVADCTGHGVPGAMVSLVGTRALNSSVREHGLTKPSEILDQTNTIVLEAFTDAESGTIIKDGMDIAFCALDYSNESIQLQFSGAHNPIWIVRKITDPNLTVNNQELEPNIADEHHKLFEIKGSKQPIGYFEKHFPFENYETTLQPGDRIYLNSDGYADQFGGPNGKKFKYKALKKLLLTNQNKAISNQRKSLENAFKDWKGDLEQLDDVCLMGIEV